MTVWMAASLVLLFGTVVPSAVVSLRGGAVERLVGLQQMVAGSTLLLMVFSQASGRSDYLVVPLVLVLASFTGALVYARLLVPRR